jgi:ComF family protein
MGKLCEEIATDCVIVHVPTTAKRTRQRGYDQAKLIAGELSRITGLPRFDCLARSGKARQVGASRAERLKQLQAAFRLKKPVAGKHIVLIDDVVTTGATLEAAAKVLHVNGASSVHAIVFAQP